MPRQPTGSAYSLSRLHLTFLVGNVLLLITVLSMIVGDYRREWKDVQREFHHLERTRAAEALQKELQTRDRTALEQAQADLAAGEAALAEHETAYAAARTELDALRGREYELVQALKFAKAKMAVFKYNYELARDGRHDLDVAATEADFTETSARIEALETEYETFKEQLAAAEAKVETFTGARDEARKRLGRLTEAEQRIRRRLRRLDDSYTPNKIRDAPLIDFMDPRVKIQQILLPKLVDDLNMDTTMKIDRCTTCHLAIDKASYADAPAPYAAHPNPELFVAAKSAHPMERFGCTVCHSGRGRGTTFLRATHWPNTREEEQRWKTDHDWHEMHHWDYDQFPKRFIEASCYQCHKGQVEIEGAPKWTKGIRLMRLNGCFGCHKVRGFEETRKAGPTLRRLAAKTTPEWAYKWIRDPRGYRPGTRMPQFFDVENINDSHNRELTTAGINAIVTYLFAENEPFDMPPVPVPGDAGRGKDLVFSVGCMGCHELGEPTSLDRTDPRNFGPNLANLGSKLNERWLFTWLKNPHEYFPRTWMPNLRLSDQEAADITAYLLQFRDAEWDAQPRPESPPDARRELMLEYLTRTLTRAAALEKLGTMSTEEQDRFLGEHLIRRNGCFGCHDIRGFENEQRIGTELTEEGSKDVTKFDFGLLPSHPAGGHVKHAYTMDYAAAPVDTEDAKFYVPRTRHDWIMTKLLHPRIWDRGRVKKYDEYLKMPWFDFTPEEAEAITTAVLSFQRSLVPGGEQYRMSPARQAIAKGRALVQEYNCRACHVVEGTGRAIAATTEDPAFLPPNLAFEGKKVQSQWLFDFLIKPVPIRPWLKARMPTFGFTGPQSIAIVEYFLRLDDEVFPTVYYDPESVTAESLAAGNQMFTMFQCQQCHVLGEIPKDVDAGSLAPNLLMARRRLKPDWVIDWVLGPEAFQPGTRMPGFWPDGRDEESPYDAWFDGDPVKQAAAVRDHIFIGLHGGNGKSRDPGAGE